MIALRLADLPVLKTTTLLLVLVIKKTLSDISTLPNERISFRHILAFLRVAHVQMRAKRFLFGTAN